MKIKRSRAGDVTVLVLSGKILGGPDQEEFSTEIKTLVNEGHVDIVLDMGKVEYINSTGLGILISGYTTLKKNGGEMRICEVRERVENLLNITHLKLLFQTFDDCEKAVASFRGQHA